MRGDYKMEQKKFEGILIETVDIWFLTHEVAKVEVYKDEDGVYFILAFDINGAKLDVFDSPVYSLYRSIISKVRTLSVLFEIEDEFLDTLIHVHSWAKSQKPLMLDDMDSFINEIEFLQFHSFEDLRKDELKTVSFTPSDPKKNTQAKLLNTAA